MRRETLGERLRAIVLSTPFVAAVAGVGCQPNPCAEVPDTETFVVALSSVPDGGSYAFLPDGGETDAGCFPACANLERTPEHTSQIFREVNACQFQTTDAGQPGLSCTIVPFCEGGRRPFTIVESAVEDGARNAGLVGTFFARAARLEAASVHAFRILARELGAHGAPANLIAAARRSALDEVRHSRVTTELAFRWGAKPLRPVLRPATEVRGLEAVAMENAIEGCARETYGAAVALWQARHAEDVEVRNALANIADDEVRHAELSWAVAGWAEPRLSQAARSRVAKARANAFDQLELEAAASLPTQLVAMAGLPPPESGYRLARCVRAAALVAPTCTA